MPDLDTIFPEEDYRFQVRFDRGTAAGFFGRTSAQDDLLRQRRRWLDQDPHTHAALLTAAEPLLAETVHLAESTGTLPDRFQPETSATGESFAACVALGKNWEADFLLLKPDPELGVRLVGGCVCFPSSWSLSEKMGHRIETIHDVVPGLNQSLGTQINTFLTKLRPGVAWLRANWGLSRSPELNQHPNRRLPTLDASVPLEEVWVRIERQALLALPNSGGVLFGIRIAVHPLSEFRQNASLAGRLARALRTMPEAMARYKNLATARDHVVELLES